MSEEPTDIVARMANWTPADTRQFPDEAWELASDAYDEIIRLRAGGCARDQKTTQHCAEAERLDRELERVKIALANAISQRDALRRALLKAFTVVEWVVGEGKLLPSPHYDGDDLLIELAALLNVQDSHEARRLVETKP